MPERNVEYQRLDQKMGTGFLVTAPSWQRLYSDAALCLTDLRVKLDRISDGEKKTVKLTAPDKEGLMAGWLNEILQLFQSDRFLPKRVVFTQFDGKSIQATLWGENYNPQRHGTVADIKTVLAPKLQLGEAARPEPHFFARIVLDL